MTNWLILYVFYIFLSLEKLKNQTIPLNINLWIHFWITSPTFPEYNQHIVE